MKKILGARAGQNGPDPQHWRWLELELCPTVPDLSLGNPLGGEELRGDEAVPGLRH